MENPKVFCLCVGGCGSKYLVQLLTENGIPGAFHEAAPAFDRLGIDYFNGKVSRSEAASRLAGTRDAISFEASNRLFSLADPISDAYPGSRFIFLFRDGRESVRSIWSNPKIDDIMTERYRFREIARAPTGREISTLEKVCLYWSNINDRILNDLKGKDHLFLSFEDLTAGRIDALQDFLGTSFERRTIPSVNEKPDLHGNRKPPYADWDQANKQAFDRLCGKTMMALGYF